MGFPGVFEPTIFSGFSGFFPLKGSAFIVAAHPKTEIAPTRAAMQKVLDAGWWGQMKVHGHRAQIHLAADPNVPHIAYTRQGQLHKVKLPDRFVSELRRLLAPADGYYAVDAEWLKGDDRLFLFDYLKRSGQVLSGLTYAERYQYLPRVYRSPCVETLPVLRNVDDCLAILSRTEPWVEGLVFKAPDTPGFRDSAVVRCRRAVGLH